MNDTHFLVLVAVAGLAAGLLAFQFTTGSSYCTEIEQGIQQNKSFNGSVACYPPGVLNVNVSDEVDDRTEIRCVCRKTLNGVDQYITITTPSTS